MTLDIRPIIGFVLFLIAAGYIIYAMSGPQSGVTTGTAAEDPHPWVLIEYIGRTSRWRHATEPNRFPSKAICNAAKNLRQSALRRAGKPVPRMECRHDPRY